MYLCREPTLILTASDLSEKEEFSLDKMIIRLAIAVTCLVLIAAIVSVAVMVIRNIKSVDVTPSAEAMVSVSETEVVSSETVTEETTYVFDIEDVTDAPTVTTVPTETDENGETASSRTVITSRQRKEYDQNSVYIDMESVLQNPELPVGCEITALTIYLRYLGFDADKVDLAQNYLPKGGNAQYKDDLLYKDSFFDYFIGDPFSRGYGCFSNAIVKAANSYLDDHGGGYDVINISGSNPDVLYDYLAQDIPVICWATDGMIEPEYYESWYDNATGEKLDWYLNEHCFVLAGFNMSADLVTLNDPMKGIIDYNINKFETRYEQMYSQAIVILKSEDTAEDETSETATAETAEETENGLEEYPSDTEE